MGLGGGGGGRHGVSIIGVPGFFFFFFFAIDGDKNGHRPDEEEYYEVEIFFVCLLVTLVRAMERWRGGRDYYKCCFVGWFCGSQDIVF